ncbi:MAG: GNAT family N-acetyltransferase [Saprospiraceae bacterium]|nr:GNAT family N-acetyltransferase [Saprospiraceae bacterium]
MVYLSRPYNKSYNKINFHCGNVILDEYIKTQASQDIKKRLAVCFVLLQEDQDSIIGFYTLSNGSLPNSDIPENLRKKYPKSYDYIPITLLGRLAIDERFKGKGNGSLLLIDALKRCLSVSESELGSVAVVVDPVDSQAENFYHHFGFIKLPDSGKMFLDMNIIKKLVV